MKEQFVSVADISDNNINCPHCGSKTYVLIGNDQIGRMEDWQNGQLIHTTLGDESTHFFELEVIECLACRTRTRVKTVEMIYLVKTNEALRRQIQDLTGRDPYGQSRPN